MKKILVVIVAFLLAGCTEGPEFDLAAVMTARPDTSRLVFDYTGALDDVSETVARYLGNIRDTSGVEIVVASIPSLYGRYAVNEAAVEIFSNWGIGRRFGGRGVLLLLVEDEKQVRLEVGLELEDVFTDLFSGYIEEKQLRPYYSSGNLETGLIAVLEELESRARMKFSGEYDRADIDALDSRYLSQGGGARYELETLDSSQVQAVAADVNQAYPAGKTPKEAWESLIKKWGDRQKDPNLGVLTPTARLAYRDYANMSDSALDENYRTYSKKDYTVLQDGNYAVIYFGKKSGWDNSPFLLCRTGEGWQFDLVHQRRYIRMGSAPDWGVEFSEYPHMGLLMDSFSFGGQDIPLTGDDLYTTGRDAELARAILTQEALQKANPDAFEPALALGRLYTLTAMSRKAIAMLQAAKGLDPEDPRPYKYLAVANVDAYYQYDTALEALDAYIEKMPEDVFGYNFKGYILYRKGEDADAAESLERALSLDADNCYAHYYLSYVYARRCNDASRLDPRRKTFLAKYKAHVAEVRSFREEHPLRVEKLNRWLDGL